MRISRAIRPSHPSDAYRVADCCLMPLNSHRKFCQKNLMSEYIQNLFLTPWSRGLPEKSRARPDLRILPQRYGVMQKGQCCCNFRPVWFAARADPPCCQFSSAHQRMLRYTATASLDLVLCSLRNSQPADSPIYSQQAQRTTGGTPSAASSPKRAPSRPNLNLKASRPPTPPRLRWGRMLKSVRALN
jgi:hypothetical protein